MTRPICAAGASAFASSLLCVVPCPAQIDFEHLVNEIHDLGALSRFPDPPNRQMQASSFNRESRSPDEPGWIVENDGAGFIRTIESGGRTEWVVMEHDGPGCLTRLWAPFFYRDFGDRAGPTVRVYLDSSPTPVIECRLIELLTNADWPPSYGPSPARMNEWRIPSPLARFTARAGVSYLPVPFATSCRITFDQPPFYYIINWRAYEAGTPVATFQKDHVPRSEIRLRRCIEALTAPTAPATHPALVELPAGGIHRQRPTAGPGAIRTLRIRLSPAEITADAAVLRSLILRAEFDGVETIWCPVGDFFGSPNSINPFHTLARSASADGMLTCRWVMPFSAGATISIENIGTRAASVALEVESGPSEFDERSMHFHAAWNPDHARHGNELADMNIIEAVGRGVLVGDQLTVINPTEGWWGEGDEKIYIDSTRSSFPNHFGTGTEDYYGWAGGVVPTPQDIFSHPFLANIAVGSRAGPECESMSGATRGFNICTRERTIDAVPFERSLIFDLEASPGLDQRRETDRLGYSTVAFWYARPGASCNRSPDPAAAKREILRVETLEQP